MGRFWSKFRNGNFKIFDLSHQTVKISFLIVYNWLGMPNNIYLSTLYKNILPNPDFRAHFGTKIFVPKFSFRNALFIQLSPQIHHKIILNSYLMRLSIVLWFVMVSEQFEQIFQNMLFLTAKKETNPLTRLKFLKESRFWFRRKSLKDDISTTSDRIVIRFFTSSSWIALSIEPVSRVLAPLVQKL